MGNFELTNYWCHPTEHMLKLVYQDVYWFANYCVIYIYSGYINFVQKNPSLKAVSDRWYVNHSLPSESSRLKILFLKHRDGGPWLNIVVIWQERCSLYAEVLYLHDTFIACTMPHHLCIMWLQIFMVPMCTLGCALAVEFVATLSGQRSIILRWHWVGLNSLLWVSKFLVGRHSNYQTEWIPVHILSMV